MSGIRAGLEAAGAAVTDIAWDMVATIPRSTVDKAPLVRADPSTRSLAASRDA